MSRQVILELPEGAFSALRAGPEEMGRELRLAAAVKWFEIGRLSQGKAAELAGLSRHDFVLALSAFNVSPLQETADEVSADAARDS